MSELMNNETVNETVETVNEVVEKVTDKVSKSGFTGVQKVVLAGAAVVCGVAGYFGGNLVKYAWNKGKEKRAAKKAEKEQKEAAKTNETAAKPEQQQVDVVDSNGEVIKPGEGTEENK